MNEKTSKPAAKAKKTTPKTTGKVAKSAKSAPKVAKKELKTVKSAAKKAVRESTAKVSRASRRKVAPSASVDKRPETTVVAMIDVGFGNQLYIRGEGAGLSWETGALMSCKGSDCWEWTSENATEPFEFKILINDDVWAQGENIVAKPGRANLISPAF